MRKKVEQLLINHTPLSEYTYRISRELFPNLTFEAVHEIDISNCPMLHLEVAIECFSKSLPSLRKLKAANHLDFSTAEVLPLVMKCPLLCDIDLTVDVSPAIPTRVSILSSWTSSGSDRASWSYMSRRWPSNITKLSFEGRIDFSGITQSIYLLYKWHVVLLRNTMKIHLIPSDMMIYCMLYNIY